MLSEVVTVSWRFILLQGCHSRSNQTKPYGQQQPSRNTGFGIIILLCLHILACSVILSQLHEAYPTKYGEIYRVFIGSKVYVVVSAPELIEPVANSSKHIDKGIDYSLMQQWLGDGLLISSGDDKRLAS